MVHKNLGECLHPFTAALPILVQNMNYDTPKNLD